MVIYNFVDRLGWIRAAGPLIILRENDDHRSFLEYPGQLHVGTNTCDHKYSSGSKSSALTPYELVECRSWLHRIDDSLCHLEKKARRIQESGN